MGLARLVLLVTVLAGGLAAEEQRKSWLARQQRADGGWAGADQTASDPAATGLAVLAFLGAGFTDRDIDNTHSPELRVGLRYLQRAQDAIGRIGRGALMEHAIATLALTEAAAYAQDTLHEHYAQKAIDYLVAADWPNDIVTLGWITAALRSAQFGKLAVPAAALAASRNRIEANRDPAPRAAAIRLVGRIWLGDDPRKSEAIGKEAAVLQEHNLAWGERDDMYWFFGTLGMFQVGGSGWKSWNEHMKEAIVKHQWPRGAGAKTGSWDPAPDAPYGRVGTSALLLMCLETYYRYDNT